MKKQITNKIKSIGSWVSVGAVLATGLIAAPQEAKAEAQDNKKPNIILIYMDNFAYGELGCYGGGITRGAATPHIDKLAEEGFRSCNYNVEAQCTPSRANLLTGRYAIRTGCTTVPGDLNLPYGLTQWEYTMPEMLTDAGYSTAMYGKWHLGNKPGRFPTDQGFDEWWGLPNSSNVSEWPNNPRIPADIVSKVPVPEILTSVRDGKTSSARTFDLTQKASIDGEITDMTIDYIDEHAKDEKPFFVFLSYINTHVPRIPAPEFAGKTGNGSWADILLQTDTYVGKILESIEKNDIYDNTIVIFTSDNGGDFYEDNSFPGMWRGTYFTGLEGSLRVPFIIRWPGKIPERSVSNEILLESDVMVTLAAAAGGTLPTDRIYDGKNELDFLMGKTPKSQQEVVIAYVADQIHAVKWRNWKGVFKGLDKGYAAPIMEYPIPVFYDLYTDPREEKPYSKEGIQGNSWVISPVMTALSAHLKTLEEEPPIKAGTLDPYVPSKKK
jgi:arylsulfatase